MTFLMSKVIFSLSVMAHCLVIVIIGTTSSSSSSSLSSNSRSTCCISQIIETLVRNENGDTLEFIILSTNVSSTLSQLPSAADGTTSQWSHSRLTMSISKISKLRYKSFAQFEQVLGEMIPDIFFTIEKFHNLRIFVEGQQDTQSVIDLLKMVGQFDRTRFTMSRKQLSPEVYILWPPPNLNGNSSVTIADVKNSIRESFGSADDWPTMASTIYIVLLQAPQKHGQKCDVYEFYSILNGGPNNFILDHVPKPGRNYVRTRTNFYGSVLTVTAAAKDMTMFENDIDSKSGLEETVKSMVMSGWEMSRDLISTGVCIDVLHYLEQIFNFSIRVVPASKFIQLPSGNESWTGIGKLLLDQNVDLSIDQSIHVSYRAQYFTFLLPVFSDRVNIYFRQPSVSSVNNIFLQPFSSEIWAIIGTQFIIYMSLLLVLKQLELRKKINPSVLTKNNLLLLMSFITTQGWYRQPKQTWLCILFFVGSATGLILFNAYSAKLVSLFATPPMKPIDSLETFVDTPRQVYASATSPYWDAIFHGYMPGKNPKQLQFVDFIKGINLALAKSTVTSPAVLSTSYNFYPDAEKLLNQHGFDTAKCFCEEVSEISVLQSPFRLGMIVPKYSPLKEYFNHAIIQVHENGLLARAQRYFIYSYKPICSQLPPGQKFLENMGLDLSELYSAFVVIVCGVCVSLSVLVYEVLILRFVSRWFNRRTYRKQSGNEPSIPVLNFGTATA